MVMELCIKISLRLEGVGGVDQTTIPRMQFLLNFMAIICLNIFLHELPQIGHEFY